MSSKQVRAYEAQHDEAVIEHALDTMECVINRHELGLEKMPGNVMVALVSMAERLVRRMDRTRLTDSYRGRIEGIKRVQRRWHLKVVN